MAVKLFSPSVFRVMLMVAVLLLIVGLFYWFEWRPSQTRKKCSDLSYAAQFLKDDIKRNVDLLGGIEDSPANKLYRLCLSKYGMKPEPLF